MIRERFRGFDYPLLLAAFSLIIISGIAMASAASTISASLALRHWTWSAVGLVVMLLVANTNYLRWVDASWALYLLSVLALILVQFFGPARLGATRWLSIGGISLQPSELAKFSTVLLLSHALSGRPGRLSLHALGASAVIMAVPAGLIFIQPDLGSASILIAIWLGMVVAAGASRRALIGMLGVCLAALPFAWHVLKEYQRDRLLVFVNPQSDPLGAGYTIIQSVIAIGSGRLTGRGWFSGTQNQLSFLPERHSDFLFSVIGEEWGFLGCAAVVALFCVMLLRMARLSLRTGEPCAQLIAAGFFSWIAYQAFVNMGMVMGALPVVGVPLPLISFGGSSMVMVCASLGLLQSIAMRSR